MQKGNAGAAGAAADPRRYRFRTGRFGFCEGGLEIVDADADMVNTGAPSVEEAGDGRFRGQGSEQFDPRGSFAEEGGPNALRGNGFLSGGRLAEDGGPLPHGFRQRVDRDSNVVDYGRAQGTVALVH